jgi:hypothetical protein
MLLPWTTRMGRPARKCAVEELFDFAGGVVDVAVEFYFLRRETKRRPDGAPSIFSAIPTPLG